MTNRTALITGAASGIGAATALRLAQDGTAVALLARRRERLDKLAARIAETGGTAIVVPADVTDEQSVNKAAQEIQDRLGDIDLLVNNAGSMLVTPFGDLPAGDWRRLVDVNVNGLLTVTRTFLPVLKRSAAGRTTDLVTVSSIAAQRPVPGLSVYGATKAAVSQLTRSLRAELADDGIRVTNIEPGMTDTELADGFSAELRAAVDELRTSLPALQADEVADVIAYVVSRPRNVNLPHLVVQPAREV
jgi:NADP-dependent 3-hydroxy acid dehydrogenase YdfG